MLKIGTQTSSIYLHFLFLEVRDENVDEQNLACTLKSKSWLNHT